ncbi:MAG TPA: hypothetical protein VL737_01635 [Candidatus Pristimantibacillus sp.]|nr:hypothetical protein [Candidatus Pristimantibacillus sp.]
MTHTIIKGGETQTGGDQPENGGQRRFSRRFLLTRVAPAAAIVAGAAVAGVELWPRGGGGAGSGEVSNSGANRIYNAIIHDRDLQKVLSDMLGGDITVLPPTDARPEDGPRFAAARVQLTGKPDEEIDIAIGDPANPPRREAAGAIKRWETPEQWDERRMASDAADAAAAWTPLVLDDGKVYGYLGAHGDLGYAWNNGLELQVVVGAENFYTGVPDDRAAMNMTGQLMNGLIRTGAF